MNDADCALTGGAVHHLDLLGEPQIGLRDATGIVRRQHDRDLGVSNVDVRMVIHVVGDSRQAVDEANSVGESIERERLGQDVAATRPPGQRSERALHFEIRKLLSHVASRLRVGRRLGFYTRIAVRAIALGALIGAPCRAQDSTSAKTTTRPAYWVRFGAGAISSILFHEAAHIATSYAVGGHPTFGFDRLRPTIFSGINSHIEPHKQFLFSAAGLTAQSVLDEAVLDIPHTHGGIFERGLLGGGIGTTLFYLTIGRTGSVSDVDFMARTHALTKTQATLIFGGVALVHSVRIARNPAYANFFARPSADGRVRVGVEVRTR
jgi:hypothetical protein